VQVGDHSHPQPGQLLGQAGSPSRRRVNRTCRGSHQSARYAVAANAISGSTQMHQSAKPTEVSRRYAFPFRRPSISSYASPVAIA
jgi:hypothetical protein